MEADRERRDSPVCVVANAAEPAVHRALDAAALRRALRDTAAIAVTSGVFGIWYVRPAMEVLSINRQAGDRRATAATVTASVAATAAGGVVLSSLRARSGSLAAPILLHLAVNCTGALAAWATGRRRGSRFSCVQLTGFQ